MSDDRPTPALRAAAEARAGGRCEYCKTPSAFCPDPFSVEHVVPRAAGGTLTADNVAWSCQGCNGHKNVAVAALDAYSGRTVRLFHPRTDRWAHHFAWAGDGTELIGLTPCGRATIDRLRLNRLELVNLRRLLLAFGHHPPPA